MPPGITGSIMQYDVLIPAAPKDYNKVPFVVESLRYLEPQPQHIYVVSPDGIQVKDTIGYCDYEVLSLNPLQSKYYRPQWIFQQFIKLFQDITRESLYLVVDSDLIFNRKFEVFPQGNRTFFLGIDQRHTPYFNLMQQLFGFGRVYPWSFISEVMLFDKSITQGITPSVESLYTKVCDLIDSSGQDYLIADYELYGNYVTRYYPTLYHTKHIKTKLSGIYSQWNDDMISNIIASMSSQDYDTFTIHTWI